MDIATALIQSLKFGLSIWNTKESRKYLDEVIDLETKRSYEKNKLEKLRNHAFIDGIDNRLCIIADATAKFGKPNS